MSGHIFLAMLVGHAVADYPLQGDFLARGKNHKAAIPGVPWQIILANHALIHAGAVALITGSTVLGIYEFGLHCLIDFGKCDGWFGEGSKAFTIDQALHVACKILWTLFLFWGPGA